MNMTNNADVPNWVEKRLTRNDLTFKVKIVPELDLIKSNFIGYKQDHKTVYKHDFSI